MMVFFVIQIPQDHLELGEFCLNTPHTPAIDLQPKCHKGRLDFEHKIKRNLVIRLSICARIPLEFVLWNGSKIGYDLTTDGDIVPFAQVGRRVWVITLVELFVEKQCSRHAPFFYISVEGVFDFLVMFNCIAGLYNPTHLMWLCFEVRRLGHAVLSMGHNLTLS